MSWKEIEDNFFQQEITRCKLQVLQLRKETQLNHIIKTKINNNI
jgi:hypothetical protein